MAAASKDFVVLSLAARGGYRGMTREAVQWRRVNQFAENLPLL